MVSVVKGNAVAAIVPSNGMAFVNPAGNALWAVLLATVAVTQPVVVLILVAFVLIP